MPGHALTAVHHGAGYFKTDMSFVKRFPVGRRINVEARMDLFNVFDTVNFTPTSA